MKRKIFSTIGALLAAVIAGCNSNLGGYGVGTGDTPTGTIADLESIAGSADVAVDSKFQYTFSRDADTSTVTTSTFFILPTAVASIASPVKGAYDSGACNAASALIAAVDCYTAQKCILTPSSGLSPNTSYTVCLTPGILYASSTSAIEAFVGATFQFTTAGGVTPTYTYTVGGTVSGLSAGETLVLQNNSADDLTITADGSFTFATAVADGAVYAVTVLTEPADKTCTVTNGTGTVSGANVTNVSVVCVLARWAKSVTAGTGGSYFSGVSVDASGNAYAVGGIEGNQEFGFGNGVTASGTYAAGGNIIVVKYDTEGTAQWAKTVTAGADNSVFNGVSVDTSDNVYTVGSITGTETAYNFGDGVTATAPFADNDNVVIVKYNSDGTAQWANTVAPTAANQSYFSDVSIDASGNAYVVGIIAGNQEFDFGNSKTATGAFDAGGNVVIVKYNSSGTAQWANTVTAGLGDSSFNGVSIDTSGNVYAVGRIYGNGEYDFGDGVTATEAVADSVNVVIVKYNTEGTAQWANTVTEGALSSVFGDVSVDASGNVYAVGNINGSGTFGFGNGVTVNGGNADSGNVVIVKYNSSGTAQWARSVAAGAGGTSSFTGVVVDASGNVYAVGTIAGTGSYTFGDGVTATGTAGGNNVVIVKYNSGGTAQWAKPVIGDSNSEFFGTSIDSSGNPYAVGSINGSGTYTFDDGVTVAGAADNDNVVIVKYKAE